MPEEALQAYKFSIPRQAPVSLKTLFTDRADDLDPLRQDGRFKLPNDNLLRFGYDFNDRDSHYVHDDDFMRRESIYGPADVNFQNMSAIMHQDGFTRSAYYNGRFHMGAGSSIIMGARYEELGMRPGDFKDDETIYPRATFNYDLGGRFRVQVGYGLFAEYEILAIEDGLDPDLQLLTGGINLTEQDIFRIKRAEQTIAALEYDFTKRSTLRIEGFKSKADRGMNFSLRHRR